MPPVDDPSSAVLRLQARIACPHCWHEFPPDEALSIAQHPDLMGDDLLGADFPKRFVAKRFTLRGDALDARGVACPRLACPRCHLAVPRPMFEWPAGVVSIAGAPGCGKSYLLAAMVWRLRELLPRHLAVEFRDADTVLNQPLHEAEARLFLSLDADTPATLKKTDPDGELYDVVLFEGQGVSYPRPLVFSLAPRQGHPGYPAAGTLSRTLCLYDNAGQDFLPRPSGPSTAAGHLGRSHALMFLFDPTQDPRFRKLCQGKTDDPQMRQRTECLPHERPESQQAVLEETIRRMRGEAEAEPDGKDPRPVVVVVTKFDSWRPLLGKKDLPSPWTEASDAAPAAVDLGAIGLVSRALRSLLVQVAPEIVAAAEGFAANVTYLPASATGHGPSAQTAKGELAFRPRDMEPIWAEVPLVYLASRWLFGSELLPAMERGETAGAAVEGVVVPSPLTLDLAADVEQTAEIQEPAAEATTEAQPAADQPWADTPPAVGRSAAANPLADLWDAVESEAAGPAAVMPGDEAPADTGPQPDQRRLEALLRRHRLLALGHGPLRSRLDTLRQLAESDPPSRLWPNELRVLERERLKEIQQEAEAAIAARDLPALAALGDELESHPWLEPLPPKLIKRISEAGEGATAAEGVAEMQRVADELNAARAADDVPRGRRLRQRWDRLNTVWGLEVDEQLSERAAPALAWLAELDAEEDRRLRIDTAVAALEDALREKKTAEELERIYSTSLREGDELPPSLEKSYRTRVDELRRAAKLKFRLAIAGIVAASAVILAVIVAAGVHFVRAHRVTVAARTLEPLVKLEDREEAQSYLEQLRGEGPAMAADPRILALSARLDDILHEENDRLRRFRAAVAAFNRAMPGRVDRDALGRAERLVRTPEEDAIVRGLKQQIVEGRENTQARADANFLKRLNDLNILLDQARRELESNPRAAEQTIGRADRDFGDLQVDSVNVSEAVREQMGPVAAKLKALTGTRTELNEQEKAEQGITPPSGDPAAFRGQLQEYARRFSASPRAAQFTKAIEDEPAWKGVAQWNQFLQTARQTNAAKLDPATAARWVARLSDLLRDHGDHPDAEAYRRRLPYFEAAARRRQGGRPLEAPLRKWIEGPLMTGPQKTGLWVLTDSTGRRYYLKSKLDVKKETTLLSFECLVGPDLAETRRVPTIGRAIASVAEAPQTALAKNLLLKLSVLHQDYWERSFYQAAYLVFTEPAIDPVLKHRLLRDVLDVACKGSCCMERAMAAQLKMLKESKVNFQSNWLDPEDEDGKRNRQLAQADLGALPDLMAAGRAAAAEQKALAVPLGTEYRAIGWLRRDRDRAWHCMGQGLPYGPARLWVIRPAEGRMAIEAIGRLVEGVAKIDAAAGPLLLEGRPVYMAEPEPPEGAKP